MKKKKLKHVLDLYIGGEKDNPDVLSPEGYGRFFNKKWIWITFLALVVLLLLAGVSL
ncbi:MAG: hypothetical protein GTN36_00495 [Candidatus Aenigmarchaeota archaeon]|nr:hypothetical protein [Candidatus Aenigmarchaeota archaeon]